MTERPKTIPSWEEADDRVRGSQREFVELLNLSGGCQFISRQMPVEFGSDWREIELKLPRDFDPSVLRDDYREVIQKIRSLPCSVGGDAARTQFEGGNRTWKCKACFVGNKAPCDWLQSE